MRTITTVNVMCEPVRPELTCSRKPGPVLLIASRSAAEPALGRRIPFSEPNSLTEQRQTDAHSYPHPSPRALGSVKREWNKPVPPESMIRDRECLVKIEPGSRMSVPDTQPLSTSPSRSTGRPGKFEPELPAADTKRWSSRRKAAVVIAIRGGAIARADACTRFALSEEELAGWEIAFDQTGIPGLRSGIRNLLAGKSPPDSSHITIPGSGSCRREAAAHPESASPGPLCPAP
jgi:hypothetical protein